MNSYRKPRIRKPYVESPAENNNIPMPTVVISIGDTISNRYLIESEIAQTALSAIYIAKDIRLERQVALKHVFKKSVTDDFRSLIREAHLLSTMSHPNVLTVYDCTADDRGTYIISEYLDGLTLEKYVEEHKLSISDFISIAEQMLLGLSEAHNQGIVHGDIKPNNIIILERPNGRKQVKLLDFGLSRIVSDESVNAGAAVMQGSAYFMSPEEFSGKQKNVISDIYSMGCLCYFAVTGRYPFEGDNTMQIMAAHIQHKLHQPRTHRSDLPKVLDQWLMWMMNLRPETRPATVDEALETLLQCLKELKADGYIFTKTPPPKKTVEKDQDLEPVSAAPVKQQEYNSIKPSPEEQDWIKIRNHALRSLSKLITKQHASNFMVKALENHGYERHSSVPRESWRKVLNDFFAHIPDKNRRTQYIQEFEKFITTNVKKS